MFSRTIPFFITLAAFSVSSTANSNPNDIERISISANKQSTAIIDLSSNLSQIDQELLALISQEHVQQALIRVPGTWISRGNGQEHLSAIRSPVLTGAGACGAFFMAEDGLSLRAPGFCNTNQLFDSNTEQAAMIEVLRGPNSTLYGTNAVHGVINVLSPDALDNNTSSVALEAGPHDYSRAKFKVGNQSERQGILLYGNLAHDDGYKDDSGFDQQKINIIHQTENDKWRSKTMLAFSNLNQETAGFIQGQNSYKDESLKRSNPNPEAYRDARSFRAYSKLSYAPNNSSEFSLMPYLRWNDMQFLQHFLPWKSLEENSHRSIGLQAQFSKTYDDISLISGFDWDHTEGDLQETQAEAFSPTIPQGEHYNYSVQADIYSPFAQINWQVSEQSSVLAGLRYEHTDYDYNNRLSDGDACEVGVENCRFTRPTDSFLSFKEWSAKLGFNHQWTANHALFGQLAQGHRAPQVTELFRLQAGQTSAELDTETIDSLELGVRGLLQGQELFYELNLFSMHKRNFIFQDSQRQNINGGETTHQGLEFSIKYTFLEQFYLNAAGSFAKHKYDNALTLSRQNIQGNLIDTAPERMGSAQLGWKSKHGHTLELEWQHMGEYYLNPENTAEYSGHNLLNLRASVELSSQLRLSARLLNLSDADYAERADFAFGNYRYFVGEPRSIFVGIQYQFNN
jgi:outer membrane receptor protein involved in Fe transport